MAVTNDVQTKLVFGVSRRLSEAFQLMRAKLVFNLLVTAVAGALASAPIAVLLIYQIEMILPFVIAAI